MRVIWSAAAAACASSAASPAAGPGPVIEPILFEGDPIGGFVVSVARHPTINNDGSWLLEVDTDGPQSADEFIVRDGVVLFGEGQAVADPPGAAVDGFGDGLAIANGGGYAHDMFLTGTQGLFDNGGVYYNGSLLKQKSAGLIAPGLSPGTTLTQQDMVQVNADGLVLVIATISDPGVPGSSDEAVFTIDAGAGVVTLLALEGGLLPGSADPALQFLTERYQSRLNDLGQAAFLVDFAGDNAADVALYVNGALIAREGDPSPVPGRDWAVLASGLDLNNAGGYMHGGRLTGDDATDGVIVVNGQVVVQYGDPGPTGEPIEILAPLMRLSDAGDLLWYADWSSPDFATDSALFLNGQVIVREGVSTAGGVVIDEIFSLNKNDGLDMSDDGRWVIFTGELEDGRQGAFRIELPPTPPPPCPGDADGDNMVGSSDLNAVLAGFGGPGPVGDVDNDGDVDSDDLNQVLAAFGSTCP